jgi:hypothetical protein
MREQVFIILLFPVIEQAGGYFIAAGELRGRLTPLNSS